MEFYSNIHKMNRGVVAGPNFASATMLRSSALRPSRSSLLLIPESQKTE